MFKYDVLIDEEDICNYQKEINRLKKYIKDNERVVLYGPRRYGKTSILINVIGKKFLKQRKSAICCYVNLQEVKNLDSIAVRFAHGLEEAINKTFTIKKIVSSVLSLIKSLRPQIETDPLTSSAKMTFSLETPQIKNLPNIFKAIITFSNKYPFLLIMDEFQDIAFVPEAEAQLRDLVQRIIKSPVAISGSKKHILKDVFLDEQKPFYNWGKSIELKKIPYDEWKKYIAKRFENKKIKIADDALKFILDSMYYIPNYICKLCSDIYNSYENVDISITNIEEAMHQCYLDTQSRYAEKTAFLSVKQVKLLSVIAKSLHVKEITSQKIVSKSGISTRGLSKISKMLLDKGYIERDDAGLRIADPFFAYYLAREF